MAQWMRGTISGLRAAKFDGDTGGGRAEESRDDVAIGISGISTAVGWRGVRFHAAIIKFFPLKGEWLRNGLAQTGISLFRLIHCDSPLIS